MLHQTDGSAPIRGNGAPPETIREWDNQHYLHPWESMGGSDADRAIAAGGEGIYLFDPQGRRYIDGPGGMWCVQIGYGRTEIAQAIAEQAIRLPYHSPWSFASEPSAVLARKLAELAPGDLNSVFFTTGGSTAVDPPVVKNTEFRSPGALSASFLASTAEGSDVKVQGL